MVDRKRLDRIILKNNTNDWWQPELFEKNTRHLLPAELEIISGPPAQNKNYNCFIYALGLADNGELINEVKGFIYDSFVKKLIEFRKLVKIEIPTGGDLVIYQDKQNYPDNLTHIGIVDGGKIISKWAWGPLVRHNLWDVPKEYGDDIFYLKSISAVEAARLYKDLKEFNKNSALV